ncbi:MAG: DUF2158 domain-containing protein [Sphingobacteriaceae bacterium]|nr:MAG: DUF2158 domain-containing protein [Sphingobacteriaceae bacterium]
MTKRSQKASVYISPFTKNSLPFHFLIMPDTQLLPGDVVLLKSGSTRMTIASIEGNQANCEWLEGGKAHKESFSLAALRKVEEATRQRDPFFDKPLFRNSK